MSSEKYYYEKYDSFLKSDENNPTFDKILTMTDVEFKSWARAFRSAVVKEWDEKGQPPRVGYDKEGIIDNFAKLRDEPTDGMLIRDELTGKKEVIRNTTTFGNAVNQWFPTMMKTRITYTKNVKDSKSIYDYFAKDELFDTFVTYAQRHFKRDSFYHYSVPLSKDDILFGETLQCFDHAIGILEKARQNKKLTDIDYFLCPVKENKEYTGFNVELKSKQNLMISESELRKILHTIPDSCKTNVDFSKWNTYTIRTYEKGQRLFPVGLKAFRVSFCQYAVNFPPLTAKFLYEKYTRHLRDRKTKQGNAVPVVVYDPSSGWGGRIIGAMSVDDSIPLLYIGTDPNRDHSCKYGETKYHDAARFFNHNLREGASLFPTYGHSYLVFQEGSEEIHKNKEFQRFRGLVDMVFTSPPYFAKEVYSEDPEQSCHKFSQYESWRDEFLRPTLKTAVEWLRPGGYLAWNISDAVFGNEMLPLEKDSCDILESLGMQKVEILKMTLAQMPGGNRLEETGAFETVTENTVFESTTKQVAKVKGKMKNFCEIVKESGKGKMFLKYEPIFIYKKT